MARPRGFDETVALDAAIECFRRRGYEATSVRDLTDCMGIGPTSLYNSFGDKRALFIKALERYVDCSVRARLARLESSLPPKQAVRTLIEDVVERSLTDRTRGGCLLINSALEIAPHDPEVGAEIAKRLGEIEGFFRRSISAAQSSGTVSRKLNSSDFARLLLSVLLGIRVLARSKPERTLLEGVARPALSLLN
jgi:TetR/AcrR family transcriptional regulator, transcriptional repressor for nem operon